MITHTHALPHTQLLTHLHTHTHTHTYTHTHTHKITHCDTQTTPQKHTLFAKLDRKAVLQVLFEEIGRMLN